MKTLQLSTIVLLLASLFSSCTKDFVETNPSNSPKATGQNKGIASLPDLKIESNPAALSSTVKVSGTLKFDRAVNKFNYTVQVSTEQDGAGNWINFDDFREVHVDLQKDEANKFIYATNFPFEFNFIPKNEGLKIGETGWRLRVNGGDADTKELGDETLEIVADPVCTGLSLEGEVIGAIAPTDGSDLYTFTVQYTVNPCDLKFFMLKTQGGLTNGIQFIEAKDGAARTPGHSTNKVITWIEGEKGGAELAGGNRIYTVKFKKAWDGASEIELTGNWSVSASLVGGGETKVEFPSIIHK